MTKNKLTRLTSVIAISIFATPAAAQDVSPPQASPDEGAPDGDIVVTANRVQTFASKTPLSLTALSGDQLIERGVTNPTQLNGLLPNTSLVRGDGLQITIRGVTSNDGSEKGDPSAAFLLNGIYLARPQSQEVSFFDVQRVEVLRGPQGTLYGRNTTAGVVNVITHDPEFNLGARADVSYESFNHVNATGMVNIPLSDTFAVRAAVNYDRSDSYAINGASDGYSYDPFKENFSSRLTALWKPIDAISLKIIGDYSTMKGTTISSASTENFFDPTAPLSDPTTLTAVRPIYVGGSSRDLRVNNSAQLIRPFRDDREYGISGELNVGLSRGLALTYLGSYRDSDRNNQATGFGIGFTAPGQKYWQMSHEVRLAYDKGPLQVQVGGYYFKEKSSIVATFLNPVAFGFPDYVTGLSFVQNPTIAINKSVFGQANLEIFPNVRLTAGARYSNDRKSRQGITLILLDPSQGVPGNSILSAINDASRTFSRTTWRAGLDYDSPIGLFYASVATGYKAGGFNDGCAIGSGDFCSFTEDELYYKPETLTAYEAGVKLRFADNAVRLNASIFHYDYKGLQVTQSGAFASCGVCQLTQNAAAAQIDGIELEFIAQPVRGLRFRAGLDLLDARYERFTPGVLTSDLPIFVNFSGHHLPRSPSSVVTVGMDYTYPLSSGASIVARVNTRMSAKYYLTDTANLIDYYQPSYTKTDLSITYNAPDNTFYLGAYVENLEDNIVITNANFGFDGQSQFLDPRKFGVRVGVKF
ncbi:TonB-dependent receptor [Sphingobium boeckii]|uniref:Iron complex outermembrane receptor protein n=1 Tax=Sphingobium boeckii TaxID=1082345 RepID=A0A7W9AHE6_9SPHN|nr:TonB-dependent receptor [Sphingobium boeckii]MBB5685665.1 iron complex outermembrane receptor protein [Sphingobium boeckii]